MSHGRAGAVARYLCAGACLQACGGHPPAPLSSQLDEVAFRSHVRILASDDFEGRKPATNGETKTVAYLTEQFKRLGLRPGNADSFVQAVPLVELTPSAEPTLSLLAGGKERSERYGEDMVIWTKRVVPRIEISASPLVFAGYGVTAPEYGWDDYAGVDVHGKTVMVLVNDPGHAGNDPALFKGRTMTYYGRWTYKFEEAARHGAAAVLIVHDTPGAGYGWNVIQSSWTGPQLDRVTGDGNAGRASVEGWISSEAAQAALHSSGLDLTELRARSERRGFRAINTGLAINASVRNDIRYSSSSNVIALLPGRSRSKEYVFFTAHWDHLGTKTDAHGTRVYHGAADNASGVAGLLTLAQSFVRSDSQTDRSLVFLCVTAEESNLLGSAYYTEHPIFPLEDTVADINFDVLHIGGPTRDITVIGAGNSDLEDALRDAALLQGRIVSAEAEPEQGHFFRSDHFSFAKKGVPALQTSEGLDDAAHGPAWGKAQSDDYTEHRYHQPSDVYEEDWDVRGTMQDLTLFYDLGRRLANQRRRPQWYPTSEFARVRATRAQFAQ